MTHNGERECGGVPRGAEAGETEGAIHDEEEDEVEEEQKKVDHIKPG